MYKATDNLKDKYGFKVAMHFENYYLTTVNIKKCKILEKGKNALTK